MAEDEGINASGSQGVQVGSGNTQHNYYRPLDHGFLSTLSPHKAVARLRGMPHDDALAALASAPPQDAVAALKADEALTVALLADLNPRKAKELIGLMETDWPWLESLPEAAEAIARRAAQLKWDHGGSVGTLEHVTDSSGQLEGYVQRYPEGWVCFSASDTYAITGAIAEVYANSGGPRGPLRFPMDEEEPVDPLFGTQKTAQYFDNAIVCTSPHGAYIVSGKIGEKLEEVADTCLEWLGFPVAEQEDHEGYSLQRFEGGAIFSSDAGTFIVRQAILDLFDDGEIPVSEETEDTSPFSTTGWTQESQDNWGEVLNCSSKSYGTYYITGARLERYRALGRTASWLGFPVSEVDIASPEPESWIQRFEGGVIVEVHDETVAFAVPASTVALISGLHNGDVLGCGEPVSEELPIGTGTSDRIQFFENAVVTVRDGKRELWPRPAEPGRLGRLC